MHNLRMRTTINLDQHNYEFTTIYAHARGITLSAALNELVRRAEHAPDGPITPGRLQRNDLGLLEIASTGHVVTSEMVKAASEDELL